MKPAQIGVNDYKPLKKALEHIVENRRGYQSSLAPLGEQRVESFKTVGFINTGHTLKNETYSTTNLADQYYMDVYGTCNWAYHRVKGIVKSFR